MNRRGTIGLLLLAVAAMGLSAAVCRGDFMLVENFEALDPGSIDGQHGWTAGSLGGEVTTLPGEADNQVLELLVDTGVLFKPLLIANDTTRMLFLRFRYEGQHNYSLGLSPLSYPTEYSDFGPELRKSGALDDLKIHDGLNYATLAQLQPGVWYNLWVWINNDSGDSQVWLHSRGATGAEAGDQLDASGQTVFDFRLDMNRDLIRFYVKAADGGSGRDPLWIDDIYLENAASKNLANPTGLPIAADYNGDGVVDPSDYAFWSNAYQDVLSGGAGDLAADGNGDGVIDPSDYAYWSDAYLLGMSGGSSVPEPWTVVAMGSVGLALLRRRVN